MAKHDVKKIYSDADGVCLNWLSGFIQFMDREGHAAMHDQPKNFSMVDIFPTIEKPWELIADYHRSEFYDVIRAYADAKEAFKHLKANGAEIVIVTSCGDEPEIMRSRDATVEREFGSDVSDIIYLPYGSSKYEKLKSLPPGVFIDDQPQIALEGAQAGHHAILRDRSYNINEHHIDYHRVENMQVWAQRLTNAYDITRNLQESELTP